MKKCGMKKIVVVTLASAVALLSGCSTSVARSAGVADSAVACPGCPATPPGVTEYVWEEPMVDVIQVPPGLDPDGIYYRPAHQEVVEVRQGRWKYYNKGSVVSQENRQRQR